MLVRLNRNQRIKAGWLVAFVYLLCILTPAISYASAGDQAVVPCMTLEGAMFGSMHMHDEGVQPTLTHIDGQIHDHSLTHPIAVSGDDDQSSMSAAMAGEEDPSKSGPHTTSGQCCAQMSVSGLLAPLFDIAMPPLPTAVRIETSYRAVADNAPAVHYRPPIS